MSDTRSGACLCGAVKFTATIDTDISACHCRQCQQWTGGGPYIVAEVSDLEITGEDRIEDFHASAWGERGFCATCGAKIYWRMQGQSITSLAVGLLDDQSGLTMSREIFVDHRPSWLMPFAGATQSTEAQEIEKFKAYQAQQGKT